MNGDLSSGLPWLSVEGRDIVDAASRRRVVLRGLNRSGLEYAEPGVDGFLASAGIVEAEIARIVGEWGATIVRLPFNQDWVLNGRGAFPPEAYLHALDQVIFWASRAGAYTLLDLQWIDADIARGVNRDGSTNRVPPLPDPDSIALWSTLGSRYHDEPAVLFDVFNEPHDPLPGDATELFGIEDERRLFPLRRRRVTMAEWQPWARHLVSAIRLEHPRSLVFVSGVRWAYDLRGFPLTISERSSEPFANVVYSTHVYPWGGEVPAVRSARRAALDALATAGAGLAPWRRSAPVARLTWADAFGQLSRVAPVFVAEWGGGAAHLDWGRALLRYLAELDIGWAAWSWSDYPRLVVDARGRDYEPTAFGDLVRRALA